MSNIPIGPGVGGLAAGIAWGKIRNAQDEAADLAADLETMRRKMISAQAKCEGYKVVTNAIVDELKAEANGTLKTRRLSDPYNREARVQVMENAQEDELKRLSGGRIGLNRTTKRS